MTSEITKKRILYVITKSNWGGAQRYVFDLATNIRSANTETFVACGGDGLLKTNLIENGVPTCTITGLERDVSFIKELKALWSLFKIIRTVKPDIIHLNSTKAGLLGVVVGRICRIKKIVFTAHGWPFLEPRKKLWKIMAWFGSYLTALLAHKIILVSHNDYRHTRMPGVSKKCTVIHTAIADLPLLDRQAARTALYDEKTISLHEHNIWLVTNAELNHNKNHQVVIEAVAEYNSTHSTKVFYTIIGDGDLESHLRDQIELKGLTDYVKLLGYLKNSSQYLSAFDLFVLPSKKEGLPYALLEAGKARLPVLATGVGGIPELISNQETGMIIDTDNHQKIVEALNQLLENPNLRNDLTLNLESLINQEFSLELMLEKTKSIY